MASIDLTDPAHSKRSFFIACKDNLEDIFDLILARHPEAVHWRSLSDDSKTALHLAAGCGRLEIARKLIAAGALVNVRDIPNETPLHCAATFNAGANVIPLLLDSGAEIHARTSNGDTPLHCAAYFGMAQAVEILMANNADLDILNNSQNTPYASAKVMSREAVATRLQDEQTRRQHIADEQRRNADVQELRAGIPHTLPATRLSLRPRR